MLLFYKETPEQHLQGPNEAPSENIFGAVEYFYPKLQQLHCVHSLDIREQKKSCFSARLSRGAQIQRITLADTCPCAQNYDSTIPSNYENIKKLVKGLPVQPKKSIDYKRFQEREIMYLRLMFSETWNPGPYSEYRSYHKQWHFCLQDNINSHVQALLNLLLYARTYKTKCSQLNFCSSAK